MNKAIFVLGLLSLSFLGGCTKSLQSSHPQDPYESFNRHIYGVNQKADKLVVRPAAFLYENYLPTPIRSGIGNVLDNINDVTSMANDVLQGDWHYFMWDTSRVLINTTIGIFGLFNPAAALGLDARKQDFGQTLYHWGYETSSYIILPLLGPSTFRDALGVGVDNIMLSPTACLPLGYRIGIQAMDLVDARARILRHQEIVDALNVGDEYALVRSAYFQRREYLFKGDTQPPAAEEVDPYTGFEESPPR